MLLLKQKGFGTKWCSWIYSILHTNKLAPIINGEPTKWIKASRGLKQGDPLSAFLFILVSDVLDRIFKLAGANGLITGIGTSSISRDIHCIQYADDTIIFCSDSKVHISNIKFILYSLRTSYLQA